MELIKEVNILNNKKLLAQIQKLSLLLIFGTTVLSIFLAYQLEAESLDSLASIWGQPIESYIFKFLLVVGIYFLMIIVHELIHGVFYKLFHPEGALHFGFQRGIAFASSPGSRYTSGQMKVIALAPLVLINLSLVLVYAMTPMSLIVFAMLTGMHTGACAGDIYYVYLIAQAPKDVLIEDTDQGIKIYQKKGDPVC